MKRILYRAKAPDPNTIADIEHLSTLGEVVVHSTLPAYSEYYTNKGYTTVTDSNFNFNNTEFDYDYGNPPYNGGMYFEFIKDIPNRLAPNGKFCLCLPIYTAVRKKPRKVFQTQLRLDTIDMTVGHKFLGSAEGAWVSVFSGKLGVTDTVKIVLPNGNILPSVSLSDYMPLSGKAIDQLVRKGISPVVTEDFSIADKVMNSTVPLTKHTKGTLGGHIVYFQPALRQMSRKRIDTYPGMWAPRGSSKYDTDTCKDGYYITVDNQQTADSLQSLYCESKIFAYLYTMITSDNMYTNDFIRGLPDITHMAHKEETELYKEFDLSESEVARIEQVVATISRP